MPYDIAAARAAGITDDEILAEFRASVPDYRFDDALAAGVTLDDIAVELSRGPAPVAEPAAVAAPPAFEFPGVGSEAAFQAATPEMGLAVPGGVQQPVAPSVSMQMEPVGVTPAEPPPLPEAELGIRVPTPEEIRPQVAVAATLAPEGVRQPPVIDELSFVRMQKDTDPIGRAKKLQNEAPSVQEAMIGRLPPDEQGAVRQSLATLDIASPEFGAVVGAAGAVIEQLEAPLDWKKEPWVTSEILGGFRDKYEQGRQEFSKRGWRLEDIRWDEKGDVIHPAGRKELEKYRDAPINVYLREVGLRQRQRQYEIQGLAPLLKRTANIMAPETLAKYRVQERLRELAMEDNASAAALSRGDLGFVIDQMVGDAVIFDDKERGDRAMALQRQFQRIARSAHPEKNPGALEKLWLSVLEIATPMVKTGAKMLVPGIGQAWAGLEWTRQGMGEVYSLMRDSGVSHEIAVSIAPMAGVLYAAVEQVQVKQIANIGKGIGKGLAGRSIKGLLLDLAKTKGKNWVQETGEEGAQRLVTELAAELGRNIEGVSTQDLAASLWQAAKAAGEEMQHAAPAMGALSLLGLTGGVVKMVPQIVEAAEARRKAPATARKAELIEAAEAPGAPTPPGAPPAAAPPAAAPAAAAEPAMARRRVETPEEAEERRIRDETLLERERRLRPDEELSDRFVESVPANVPLFSAEEQVLVDERVAETQRRIQEAAKVTIDEAALRRTMDEVRRVKGAANLTRSDIRDRVDAALGATLNKIGDVELRENLKEGIADLAGRHPLSGERSQADLNTQDQLNREQVQEGEVVLNYQLDIDGFKRIDDTKGHDDGDEIIVNTQSRVRGTAEEHGWFHGHKGGDEGAGTIRVKRSEAPAAIRALEAIKATANDVTFTAPDGSEQRIGVTIGVSMTLPGADAVLNEGKKRGRNSIYVDNTLKSEYNIDDIPGEDYTESHLAAGMESRRREERREPTEGVEARPVQVPRSVQVQRPPGEVVRRPGRPAPAPTGAPAAVAPAAPPGGIALTAEEVAEVEGGVPLAEVRQRRAPPAEPPAAAPAAPAKARRAERVPPEQPLETGVPTQLATVSAAELRQRVSPELAKGIVFESAREYEAGGIRYELGLDPETGAVDEGAVYRDEAGVYHIITSPDLSPERLSEVVREEIFHVGSDAVFAGNPRLDARLDGFFDSDADSELMGSLRGLYPEGGRRVLKREWVARQLEIGATKEKPTGITQRVYNAVHDFLVDIGVLEADVQDVIRRLARDMRRAEPPARAEVAPPAPARRMAEPRRFTVERTDVGEYGIRDNWGHLGGKYYTRRSDAVRLANKLNKQGAERERTRETEKEKYPTPSTEGEFGQLSFETAPSTSLDVSPWLKNAPWKVQLEYHERMMGAMTDEQGRNEILKRVGLFEDEAFMAPGAWEGKSNPSEQFNIPITEENARLLDVAAAMMGLYYKQDAVGYTLPFATSEAAEANGVRVRLGRALTNVETEELYKNIADRLGTEWVSYIPWVGKASEDTGFVLVNFDEGLDNNKYNEEVRAAVNEVVPGVGPMTRFSHQGGLIENARGDEAEGEPTGWEGYSDGEGYRQRIRAAGFGSLLEWGDRVLGPETERTRAELDAEYGEQYAAAEAEAEGIVPGEVMFARRRARAPPGEHRLTIKKRIRDAVGMEARQRPEARELRGQLRFGTKTARIVARNVRQAERAQLMLDLKRHQHDIKAFQARLRKFGQTNLSPDNRRAFERYILRLRPQTKRGAIAQYDRAMRVVDRLVEREERRGAITKLKKTIKGAKKRVEYMRPEFQKRLEVILADVDPVKHTKEWYRKLQNMKRFIEENPDNNIPDEKLRQLQALERKPITEYTTEELELVDATIGQIIALNNLKNKLIVAGRYREAAEVSEAAVTNVEQKGKAPTPAATEARSVEPRTGALAQFFTTDAANIETVTDNLDNKERGVIWEVFTDGAQRAENKELEFKQASEDYFADELARVPGYERWSTGFHRESNWGTEVDFEEITLASGQTVTLTKGQRIALYLASANPRNMKHILEGGYIHPHNLAAKPVKLEPGDVSAIIESMTPEEIRFADAAFQYFNSMQKDAINETSVELNGSEVATEENYFPVRTSAIDRWHDELAMKKTPANMRAFVNASLEGMGIFQKRVDSKTPIILEDVFSAITRTNGMVAKYVGWASELRSMKMLLNGSDFQRAVIRNYGRHYLDYLRQYVQDVEGEPGRVQNIDRITTAAVNKMDVGILGLNPWVILKQPVSYTLAMTEIGPKYWMAGLSRGPTTREEMARWSPWLRERFQGGRITQEVGEIGQSSRVMSFFTDKSTLDQKVLSGILRGDYESIGRIWTAIDAEITNERPELAGDAKQEAVARRTEEVVRRTQPTFDVKDRSQLARSKQLFWKLSTKYTSQRNKNYNIVMRTIQRWNRSEKTPHDLAQATSAIALVTVFNSLFMIGVNAARSWLYGRGDDDRKKKAHWLWRLLGQTLTTTLGNVYGVDKVAQVVASFVERGEQAYGISDPLTSNIEDFGKGIGGLIKGIYELAGQERVSAGERKGKLRGTKTLMRGLDRVASSMLTLIKGLPYRTLKGLLYKAPKAAIERVTKADERAYNKARRELKAVRKEFNRLSETQPLAAEAYAVEHDRELGFTGEGGGLGQIERDIRELNKAAKLPEAERKLTGEEIRDNIESLMRELVDAYKGEEAVPEEEPVLGVAP